MSTKLGELEQYPKAELRLVSSSQVWLLLLPLPSSPLRSSLWRCTTSLCPKPFPVTTLDSTSRTSPSRTSREEMLPLILRTSLPPVSLTLPLRLSCLTTLDRSPTDTLQSLIVTQLTLLASLPRSLRRSTDVQVSQLRMSSSSSSLVMLLSLS